MSWNPWSKHKMSWNPWSKHKMSWNPWSKHKTRWSPWPKYKTRRPAAQFWIGAARSGGAAMALTAAGQLPPLRTILKRPFQWPSNWGISLAPDPICFLISKRIGDQIMNATTYVNFPGNCAEAFNYYEKHLGAKLSMM